MVTVRNEANKKIMKPSMTDWHMSVNLKTTNRKQRLPEIDGGAGDSSC